MDQNASVRESEAESALCFKHQSDFRDTAGRSIELIEEFKLENGLFLSTQNWPFRFEIGFTFASESF